MHDLKSLSTTHHEFCMETGDGYSGIHTCGGNGSSGIEKKAGHKPCTLFLRHPIQHLAIMKSPLVKCAHFLSDWVNM